MAWFAFLMDSPIFAAIAKALLHFLWQGSLIALGLYLSLSIISKKHSELRYVVSLLAMGLCVIVPISNFFSFYQPNEIINPSDLSAMVMATLTDHPAVYAPALWFNWDSVLSVTSLLWMVGVIYLSVHLVVELFTVYQLPKRHTLEANAQVTAIFEQLVDKLQVNRLTRLMLSLKAEVPMVIGCVRPVILLPISMAGGLTVAQLEMLLAHELAHVKRHDYLVNFIQTIAEVLLFFHPLVKWISVQVRIEREYCCDDIAVHTCGNAKAYATALTEAETIRSQHIPQLAMAATGGDLKGRVLRMFEQTDCANKYSRSWQSMALAALVAVGLASVLFAAHAGYQQRVEQVLHDQLPVAMPHVSLAKTASQPATHLVVTNDNFDDSTHRQHIQDSHKPAETNSLAPTSSNSQATEIITQTKPTSAKPRPAKPGLAGSGAAQTPPESANLVSTPESATVKISSANSDPVPKRAAPAAAEQSVVSEQPAIAKLPTPDESSQELPLPEPDNLAQQPSAVGPENAHNQPENSEVGISDAELQSIISPSLVRAARPHYPRAAISRDAEADVEVSFVVSTEGRVTNIKFSQGVPGYFKRSVRKALKKWRYKPGVINGELAEMSLTRVFSFNDPDGEVEDATTLRVTGSRILKQI